MYEAGVSTVPTPQANCPLVALPTPALAAAGTFRINPEIVTLPVLVTLLMKVT
jgi:hypothetical protein